MNPTITQDHGKPYEIVVTCRSLQMKMTDKMKSDLFRTQHDRQWTKYTFATDFISTAMHLITTIIRDCNPIAIHYYCYDDRIVQ